MLIYMMQEQKEAVCLRKQGSSSSEKLMSGGLKRLLISQINAYTSWRSKVLVYSIFEIESISPLMIKFFLNRSFGSLMFPQRLLITHADATLFYESRKQRSLSQRSWRAQKSQSRRSWQARQIMDQRMSLLILLRQPQVTGIVKIQARIYLICSNQASESFLLQTYSFSSLSYTSILSYLLSRVARASQSIVHSLSRLSLSLSSCSRLLIAFRKLCFFV